MSDLSLTADEQERFKVALAKAQLDYDAAVSRAIRVPSGAQWMLPADGANLGMSSRMVQSLEELNAMIGAPDLFQGNSSRDAALDYALHLSESEKALNGGELPPHAVADVQRSRDAYVYGASGKLATSALAVINRLQFPTQVNFVAALSLSLGEGAGITFGGDANQPYVVVLGSLFIDQGAQLSVTVDTSFNVQVCESKN